MKVAEQLRNYVRIIIQKIYVWIIQKTLFLEMRKFNEISTALRDYTSYEFLYFYWHIYTGYQPLTINRFL